MKKMTLFMLLFFALAVFAVDASAQQQQQRDMSKQGQQQQSQQQQSQQAQRQQSRDQMSTKGNLARAEELKGTTVRNTRGEELATVQDAIVNTQTGKIDYIVLQSGGMAGIGGDMIAVPVNSFQVTKDKRLVLNITKDALDKAPKLNEAQWPPANENKWAQNVKSYFSKQMAQSGKQQQRAQSGQQTQPTPMGRQ